MRKLLLVAAMLAMFAVAVAPAVAHQGDEGKDKANNNDVRRGDLHALRNDLADLRDLVRDQNDLDGDGLVGLDELTFDIEQNADSGDITSDYTVVNTGDNANQCVGLNSTNNTGNSQNLVPIYNVNDANGDGQNEFELEDVTSDLSVSGDNTTTCDQQVNQAADAVSY